MSESLADQVMGQLAYAKALYSRLIIIAAPPGEGKTTALQSIRDRLGVPLIDVNFALAAQLLELAGRQRSLRLPRLLSDLVSATQADVVLLDNIELLFDVTLKQDPLRLLQGLSRNRTVVAAWGGSMDGMYLYYATSGHPEYRRYPIRDFLTVGPERNRAQ